MAPKCGENVPTSGRRKKKNVESCRVSRLWLSWFFGPDSLPGHQAFPLFKEATLFKDLSGRFRPRQGTQKSAISGRRLHWIDLNHSIGSPTCRQSLENVSQGLWPGTPNKSSTSLGGLSGKSPESLQKVSGESVWTVPRLIGDFFGVSGRRPRQTFLGRAIRGPIPV